MRTQKANLSFLEQSFLLSRIKEHIFPYLPRRSNTTYTAFPLSSCYGFISTQIWTHDL